MPNFPLTEHSHGARALTKLLGKRDIKGLGLSSSESAGAPDDGGAVGLAGLRSKHPCQSVRASPFF